MRGSRRISAISPPDRRATWSRYTTFARGIAAAPPAATRYSARWRSATAAQRVPLGELAHALAGGERSAPRPPAGAPASAAASPGATTSDRVQRHRRLGQAADVADHARGAAGGRLEHDQPEALERDRGHDRHVGGAVGVDQLGVADAAEHAHPARERRLRGALAERLAQRPVADHAAAPSPAGARAASSPQASSSTSRPMRGTSLRVQTATNAPARQLELRRAPVRARRG